MNQAAMPIGRLSFALGRIGRCYGEAHRLNECAWNIQEKGRPPCIKRHSN